jgi:probable HAF family extracellular repeat protein
MTNPRRIAIAVLTVMLLATVAAQAAPATYRVVSAGTVNGRGGAPTSMNARGDMVGYAGGSITVRPTPFLFQNGVMYDLSAYGLESAESINDRGQVVGYRNGHPYIYEKGVVTDLDNVGYLIGSAHSINSLGQVVRFLYNGGPSSETWRPFLYHDGIETLLPSPANGSPSAINDRGQIVGRTSISGNAVTHPFMYDDGRLVDLGTLGGAYGSANAINRLGTIVGVSSTSDGRTRAFRYRNGSMVDLGALSHAYASNAYAINDSDQIVGDSDGRGVLWQEGLIFDLNDLLADGDKGWRIMRATGINIAGQIAASACQSEQCVPVRLEPLVAQRLWLPPSVEFYNASLDHYFMTNSTSEMAVLDTGVLDGWQRTGGYFNVWAAADPQSRAVCRFYIPPAYGDSHFYSASPVECGIARTLFPWLIYESPGVFNVHLPDATTGACPSGDIPVYRVWNQRYDSNHRYTINWIARDWMISSGYVAEGYGAPPVAMCAQ